MQVVTITTTSGTTTTTSKTVPVGLAPLGVAIDQDRALAFVANSGSNTLTSIDLTVLLPGAVTTTSPVPTTIAVSGAPTAIAVDPNRAIAVVTLLTNSGTTVATAGLDVINLAANPPIRSTSASVSSLSAALTGIVYDPAVSPALFYATSTQQNAVFPSRQPAAHFADPARRLLGTGNRLGHRAGGPSAQDPPLFFFQDLVARSVRLLSTHPGQPVNPPSHHQINGQARLQTIGILQAAILDAASAFDRAVIHFDTPASAIPVRSKNWSVSQKHPQKAISILLTF